MKLQTRAVLTAGIVAATFAPAAFGWPGQPKVPAPRPATSSGPPPAWIESSSRSTWLAYSGYCWKTACADYLPPASRPDLPTISIVRGTAVRLHFGFRPSKVTITALGARTSTRNFVPAQIVTWSPRTAGIFTLSLRSPSGTVGYAGRVRFR